MIATWRWMTATLSYQDPQPHLPPPPTTTTTAPPTPAPTTTRPPTTTSPPPTTPKPTAPSNILTEPLTEYQTSRVQRSLPEPSDEELANNVFTKLYAKEVEATSGDHVAYLKEQSPWLNHASRSVFLKYMNFASTEMSRKGGPEKRIVVVRPMGQLCNRLMSITSAFLFAILTRRVLLIEDSGFYASMNDLFETPGFPWLLREEGGAESSGAYITNPDYGDWEHTPMLLCEDYEKAYKSPSVTIAMNQYIIPYISKNPHYKASIEAIFGKETEDRLFFTLARFLYRPVKKLRLQLNDYVHKHFTNHFIVGLQVRSGPDFTSSFMREKEWGLYKACAHAVSPDGVKRQTLKYFVATDTEEGREVAARYLGRENIIFGPTEFMRSNTPEGVQMALLDLLLLASANDRVTTAWSSYGYFAAGYSGVQPNMVTARANSATGPPPSSPSDVLYMGVPHKFDRRDQCVRLKTSQPCFHKFAVWGGLRVKCAQVEKWTELEFR
eukprot:PhF_6_TR626/c1_g1_i1/m.836/K13681/FUT; xyloglucan fucosyltransferase